MRAVTCLTFALALVQLGSAQFSHRTASKGPRALGLLEVAPNGKARLIPITIMVDGKFYDAGAYKASPVPMALESGTVYEAERAGVSQGLFTVRGVRQLKDAWLAEGDWRVAGSEPVKVGHKAEDKPIMGDEKDAPPTLRRGMGKPKSGDTAPESGSPAPNSPPPSNSSASTAPAPASPTSPPAKATTPPASPTAATSADSEPAEDKSPHPVLRRGKAAGETQADQIKATASVPATKKNSSATMANSRTGSPESPAGVQLIPAISDAGGPEPRPFTYEAKPEEFTRYQKLMLAVAETEVSKRAKMISGQTEPAVPSRTGTRARASKPLKGPQPVFDNTQLKVFDLSNTNEPTLVLTATARMPQSASDSGSGVQYFVTVVGRIDINDELHKIFANTTDSNHLDVIPRLELIDAADAAGDGRGELLFHEVSDSTDGYVVYRVTPDRLWALFDSERPDD